MADPTQPDDEPKPLGITVLDEPATLEACRREYEAAQATRDALDNHVRRYHGEW